MWTDPSPHRQLVSAPGSKLPSFLAVELGSPSIGFAEKLAALTWLLMYWSSVSEVTLVLLVLLKGKATSKLTCLRFRSPLDLENN